MDMEVEKTRTRVKQPPVLFAKTQALIARLAERLDGPVVTYWNNPGGSICHDDVVALHELLGHLGRPDTIHLFIKSRGGSGQVSLRLVNLLRQHCRRLVALGSLCTTCADRVGPATGAGKARGADRYREYRPAAQHRQRPLPGPPEGTGPSGPLPASARAWCTSSTRRPMPPCHRPGRPPSRPRRLCRGSLLPLECASAATMVALGCDRILMGPTAYLTAVDTSLFHALSPVDCDNDRVSVSLDELTRVIRLWREQQGTESGNPYRSLFEHVHPLVIGAVDRAESLSLMLCRDLLGYHVADPATAERVATTLNGKYPSHNYPILLDEAVRIGLDAQRMSPDVSALLLALNARYSEMGQKATTDFDEIRAHSHEIVNIWETAGVQVFFQQDKDWFYRAEERRWISMNDNSGWRRVDRVGSRIRRGPLHVA